MQLTQPILGICGYSGSGKTTLIEKTIPALTCRGIKVAVVKHDVHGIQADQPGKDSDRLFSAGSDILLQGAKEAFFRFHIAGKFHLERTLHTLSQHYDLVLVEGHKDSTIPKVWLLGENESAPPVDKPEIVLTLKRDAPRLEQLLTYIDHWLPQQWLRTPVYGCILIGGKSRRMGKPKHLIIKNGRTWLERTIELIEQVTERTVISGTGTTPSSLANYTQLADIPNVKGPLSGILAAMRWAPNVSWLVSACDMPEITLEALHWLLSQRTPGTWGTLPKLNTTSPVEPLLAHYDYRAREPLEELASQHIFRITNVSQHPKIATPSPPPQLAAAWRNINTEDELAQGR